ncbi:opioid growth factor receptor conserved region-domain-containing protein [Infundibulicybe gibba]|nr:opioid growth factor receptor conserved region-domain-containing protein [Infundibulicybe gibba]
MSIPRDVKEFLDGYPDAPNDLESSENLRFYRNTQRCRPDNRLIQEIHDQWFGDYDKLEYKHGYIQWLFPIQEYGMNYESQPLQVHEIEAMRSDPIILGRIISSYKLMLDFYGMQLVSLESGLISRVVSPGDYRARYRNLVRSSHNNLRISRILKCLSEFGFERLNAGFLLHVLAEQSEFKELESPGIRSSMDRWWANCLRNQEEREWIRGVIRQVRSGSVVFTRAMYEKALEKRSTLGHLQSS